MGTTNISQPKVAADVVDETWYNDFRSSLIGAFIGRDGGTGVVAAGQDLGTAIYPWGNVYADALVINGSAVDFDNLSPVANAIISGRVRSTSDFPDFIRANGAAASFDVLGAATNLRLNINSTATTIAIDITKSGLTTAPVANNTALVNDVALAGAIATKFQGEEGTVITIGTVGTEISNRVGQYCAFKVSTEYFLAYVNSATELSNAYRGCMFDSAGAPLVRTALSNGNTLTLMSTAWIFAEDDAITIDVTYNSPVYAYTAPVAPVTGDYWFDRVNETWKRYNGGSFVVINRTLIGVAVIDGTNCVASRSFNFNKAFTDFTNVKLQYVSATVVKARNFDFDLSVYGATVSNRLTKYQWDIATDLQSGQTEAASTIYYAYITEEGKPILSEIKPYDQRGELLGYYHPHNSWRCIGSIANDGSSNFTSTTVVHYGFGTAAYFDAGSSANQVLLLDSSGKIPAVDGSLITGLTASQIPSVTNQQTFTSSGTWTKPSAGTYAKVCLWGAGGGGGSGGSFGTGGGGGSYKEFVFLLSALASTVSVTVGAGGAGGSTGVNGGSSSFGSHATAYGGTGGGSSEIGGAGGGVAATATAGSRYNDLGSVTGSEGAGAITSNSPTGGTYTGGGGGVDNATGGTTNGGGAPSIYGGGGGSCSGGVGVGGASSFGGAGGTNGAAGTAPAGGGGGKTSGAGAGARGEVRVYTW